MVFLITVTKSMSYSISKAPRILIKLGFLLARKTKKLFIVVSYDGFYV